MKDEAWKGSKSMGDVFIRNLGDLTIVLSIVLAVGFVLLALVISIGCGRIANAIRESQRD